MINIRNYALNSMISRGTGIRFPNGTFLNGDAILAMTKHKTIGEEFTRYCIKKGILFKIASRAHEILAGYVWRPYMTAPMKRVKVFVGAENQKPTTNVGEAFNVEARAGA